MPPLRPLLIALVALAASWPAGSARAADPAEVEGLIRQGVELRRAHDDHRALPLFQKAYSLAPTPRTAAQLGMAEQVLGYMLDAERHLGESLAASHDVWVGRNRKTLEKALAQVKAAIGEIVVRGGPAGAEVKLNGVAAGKLPLASPLRAGEGPAKVELELAGYKSEAHELVVTGGKRVSLEITMQSAASAALEPGALAPQQAVAGGLPPAAAAGLSAPPTALPVPTTEPAAADTGPARTPNVSSAARPAAWVLAAGAVAGLGLGAYGTAVWLRQKDAFDSHTVSPNSTVHDCGTDAPGHGGPGCDGLLQKAHHGKTMLVIGYAAAAALALGSTVLFIVSAPHGTEATGSSTALACGPDLALRGGACRLSF